MAATPTRGMAVHESLYLGLFLSAAMAATVLPGASEILMLGLLAQGLDSWLLWGVATAGNVVGSSSGSYATKADAENAVEAVKKGVGDAVKKEVEKE